MCVRGLAEEMSRAEVEVHQNEIEVGHEVQ